jgi:alcohol dehydrogenase, propanol-preferring
LENHLDIEALPVNSWRDRVPPVAIAMLGAVCAASLFYTPLPLLLVVGIPALYYFVSRPYELLLLMVFLIPFNFVFRIGPIPVAAELLKAFAWIPALIYFGHRRQPFRTSRYNWQFAVLSVLICVAFFRSSDLPYALAQTSRFIFNIGLYYLVINLVDSREKILQIFRVLATSTFLVACYGFYQFIIQDYGALFWIINPRIETSLAHGRDDFWAWRNRITSVLTSEMELGHYFNLCLPVGIVLWVTERFNRLSWRWLWMTIASAVGLILTFTFASWLALIATAAVFVFFFVDKRLRLKLLLGGALALAFVGCIVIFGPLRTFFVEKALGTGVGGLAWDVLGRLDFTEVSRPLQEPGPNQVRIRVQACGVCHTDSLLVDGTLPNLTYPRVPGHEVIGRIDAVGANVTTRSVGQRVGVGICGGWDDTCLSCLRGDFVNCTNGVLTGIMIDGGYAEVMIIEARTTVTIPDGLESVKAAPLLCAGVTTYNALRNAGLRAGALVAIQGVGGLGHLGIQYARRMGFRTIAIGLGPESEKLAKELGAHQYIDSGAEDAGASLRALGGADAILATAPSGKAMSGLVNGLAVRGKLLVIGIAPDPLEVSTGSLIFGMHSISGSTTGSVQDEQETVEFSLLENVEPMIEVMPLSKAREAYDRMMAAKARFRMVLVTEAGARNSASLK